MNFQTRSLYLMLFCSTMGASVATKNTETLLKRTKPLVKTDSAVTMKAKLPIEPAVPVVTKTPVGSIVETETKPPIEPAVPVVTKTPVGSIVETETKPPIEPAVPMSAKTVAQKSTQRALSSARGTQKGRVVNTPPGQVLPIPQEAKPKKNQLLDFKETTTAPWLSQYPAIQKEVIKIIQAEKQAILKDAKNLFDEFPHSVLLPYRLYVEELKLFQPANKDRVSVRMKLYTYTGGAHGGSQYYSWNYSQKQQQFLSLNDIFPISDYCAQLTMVGRKPLFQKKPLPACLKPALSPNEKVKGSEEFLNLIIQIRDLLFEHEKQGNQHDKYVRGDIQRGTAQNKHFKIWNLNQNEIIFVFPEYQVGPYVAGSFEVFVPLP